MDFYKLRKFLPTLTIKQLKAICNTNRCWGVYCTYPSISGYSKCKNKKELVAHILKHFYYYLRPNWGDFDRLCNSNFWVKKSYDFIYNGTTIDMKVIKVEDFPKDKWIPRKVDEQWQKISFLEVD